MVHAPSLTDYGTATACQKCVSSWHRMGQDLPALPVNPENIDTTQRAPDTAGSRMNAHASLHSSSPIAALDRANPHGPSSQVVVHLQQHIGKYTAQAVACMEAAMHGNPFSHEGAGMA